MAGKYKTEHEAVEAANKQLWKEKMQALKDSKGDLGELVKRTPGASAKVIHPDQSEEIISKGPEDTSNKPIEDYFSSRGKEHR